MSEVGTNANQFENYQKSLTAASGRTRFLIYLVIVASLASYAVYRHVRPGDWITGRMLLYRNAYEVRNDKQGPYGPVFKHNLERPVQLVKMIEASRLDKKSREYREAVGVHRAFRRLEGWPGVPWEALVSAAGERNLTERQIDKLVASVNAMLAEKPKPPDHPSLRSLSRAFPKVFVFKSDIPMVIRRQFEAWDTEYDEKSVGYSDAGLIQRIKELETEYSRSRRVSFPILGIEFDINDFPVVGGVSLIVILALLALAYRSEYSVMRAIVNNQPTIAQAETVLLSQVYARARRPRNLWGFLFISYVFAPVVVYDKLVSVAQNPDWVDLYRSMLPTKEFMDFVNVVPVIQIFVVVFTIIAALSAMDLNHILDELRQAALIPVMPKSPKRFAEWRADFDTFINGNQEAFQLGKGSRSLVQMERSVLASGQEFGRYRGQYLRSVRRRIVAIDQDRLSDLGSKRYRRLMLGCPLYPTWWLNRILFPSSRPRCVVQKSPDALRWASIIVRATGRRIAELPDTKVQAFVGEADGEVVACLLFTLIPCIEGATSVLLGPLIVHKDFERSRVVDQLCEYALRGQKTRDATQWWMVTGAEDSGPSGFARRGMLTPLPSEPENKCALWVMGKTCGFDGGDVGTASIFSPQLLSIFAAPERESACEEWVVRALQCTASTSRM